MKYVKRARRTKKVLRRSIKKNTKVSSTVKKYVNRVVHAQIENKSITTSFAKTMSNISNLANFQSGNIIQLTPSVNTNYIYTVQQGTGSGNRTGNVIKTRNCILRFVMYPQVYNLTSNPTPKPLDIVLYIVSTKKSVLGNTVSDIATICNTNFYRYGNTSQAMLGNLYDLVQPVNNDVIQIHHKRIFKLAPSNAQLQTGASAGQSNNDYKYNVIRTINVTKYLPKNITFDDANNNSTSKQVFAIFAQMNADGTGTASTVFPCSVFGNVDFTYEDA